MPIDLGRALRKRHRSARLACIRLEERLAPVADFGYGLQFSGVTGDSRAAAIRRDASGNLYAVGQFSNDMDADPGPGNTLLAATSDDIYITKLDSTGNLIWARSYGGANSDLATCLALDASNNLYVGGTFSSPIDFPISGGTTVTLTPTGVDSFVLKLDTNGTILWAKQLGGVSTETVRAIALDSANNLLLTGEFDGTVDFNPGPAANNLAGFNDIFVWKLDTNGNYVWAKGLVGTSSNGDLGSAIATDALNNVLVGGGYSLTVDFDPGGTTANQTSSALTDLFLLKLDSAGNYVWHRSIGGSSNDYLTGLATDASGNVFATGNYGSSVDFDAGAGSTLLPGAGVADIFAFKYTSAGLFTWAKGAGSAGNDSGSAIAVDTAGNVLVTGYFAGTADFDPSAGTANLTAADSLGDAFLWKLTSAGNYSYAKAVGGAAGADAGTGVVTDPAGAAYGVGFFSGAVDFDPGVGVTPYNSLFLADMYAWKLDSAGTYQWSQDFGDLGTVNLLRTTTDSAGNVYVAGNFTGQVDFDPSTGSTVLTSNAGTAGAFVAKYTAGGSLVWARASSGSAGTESATGLAVDASNNVFWVGNFNGAADFDPGAGVSTLTPFGGNDVFAVKLDANGNFLFAKQLGGTGADSAGFAAVDPSGNLYIGGQFTGTSDFDPSASTANLVSVSSSTDAYLAKLSSAGAYVWAKQFGGTGTDIITNVAVNGSNVVAVGNFTGSGDFNPGAATTTLTSIGGTDPFFVNLDLAGNLVWAKSVGGTSQDTGTGIGIDGAGNVLACGNFFLTVDFDPGAGSSTIAGNANSQDAYLLKLDSAGSFVWARQFGGTNTDAATALAIESGTNKVTLLGSFNATADFDPGAGSATIASNGLTDIYLVQVDSAGLYQFAKRVGGASSDSPFSLAQDSSGNWYATGSIFGTVDINPDAPVVNLAAGSTSDNFLLKLTATAAAAPQASSSPGNVILRGATNYSFTVTYTDATAINASTLDSSDVRVTGFNGFNVLASFVSVTPAGNGSPRTATYTFNAPGGSWNAVDNGSYTVALQGNQVANTAGTFVPAGTLGTFTVSAPASVQSILVNGTNAAQRSRVGSIVITYDSVITYSGATSAAYSVAKTGGGSIGLAVATSNASGVSVATLTFTTGLTPGGHSLLDGRYVLTILGNQVQTLNLPTVFLDGDNNSVAGGNATYNFFRFYGDANGDENVDLSDIDVFSTCFGATQGDANYLDYMNDDSFPGDVDIDLGDIDAFSNSFAISVLP